MVVHCQAKRIEAYRSVSKRIEAYRVGSVTLTFDLNVRILRDRTDRTARDAGVVVVAFAVVLAVDARGGVKIRGTQIIVPGFVRGEIMGGDVVPHAQDGGFRAPSAGLSDTERNGPVERGTGTRASRVVCWKKKKKTNKSETPQHPTQTKKKKSFWWLMPLRQ
jgi:hypothetical protein